MNKTSHARLSCRLRIRALGRLLPATLLVFAAQVAAQTNVTTYHYDNSRAGQNTSETILTPSNVNANLFGKLFALPVDGAVYAQPLYVSHLTIGGGTHNVVFVATEVDSVYAFDADTYAGADSSYLWRVSLIDTAHGAAAGATPVSDADVGCDNLVPNIGITSTPVIDLSTGTMYVEAKSKENEIFIHRLHAIDITSGAEKSPGPIVITATVNGTGDGSSGGQLTFGGPSTGGQLIALNQLNRPGLLLLNGTIYIAYASHCDLGPYHGWLFGYDAATFTHQSVFVTTPNGGLGGIWMSGAGLAADANGNIYVAVGNGTFDTTNVPATELGDSILKIALNNGSLNLLDYFTPFDQSDLNNRDADVGAGGVLLLPDQPGSHPHELVENSKDGHVYLVDRDQMTANNHHYCSGCGGNGQIIQELTSGLGQMWSFPAYWNNSLYFWATNDHLKAFKLTNGLLSGTPSSSSTTTFGFPGATPVVSSNGTSNGIVWAIDSTNNGTDDVGVSILGPAVLHAYDATNVANEFYNSTQAPNNRDQAGDAVKFTVPVVVNGKVYIGTSFEVDVYGLSSCFAPAAPAGLFATPGNTQASLSWMASAGALSYNVKRGTNSGGPYTTVVTGITATSNTDTGLTNGTTYYYVVSAVNSCGESGNSSEASTTPSIPGAVANFSSDTSTQGTWHGVYGADGYSIANDSQSLPAYASFAVQNQLNYIWASSTTDPRALQTGSGTGRIASTWYNSASFNFEVNFTDGNTHRFALYAVDWDSTGRVETIQIVDAYSNAVLDTRTISSFNNGIYLVWNISGHVKINVTRTGGPNAVISGVFFGGTGTTTGAVANFVTMDMSTQGSWHGVYGADGHSIANDSQSLPAYASFAVQNQLNYTWASSTTDPRALQTGSGSGRIAATWFNSSTFNFDVNFTDGNTHRFALYAVDWDSTTRVETIQIVDANSNAVLDTRTISSFNNGIYLVWNISGHVKINITWTGGNNAVISGAFFGGSGTTTGATASFVTTDTTTEGSWHGVYGADGYSIANDSQSLPAYASFAVQNQQNYNWASTTSDPRALQTGSGSGRIAATWFNSSTFNFDVNFTDGNTHRFALYAVDWDSTGRVETIQIVDAYSNAVLDTRNIASFNNGIYLVWNISGHVKINVTRTGGANSVISGAFFK